MYTLEWVILGLLLFNTFCHLRWKLIYKKFDSDRYDELVSKLWSRKYSLMTPREQDEFDRLNKLRHSLRTSKFECQVGYVTDHLEITLRHELDVFRGEILDRVDSLTQDKKPSQRSN